jgi:hypothetical protein
MRTDGKVVVLGGKEEAEAKRKQDMIDVLDKMRMMVQSGEITEFVSCSMDDDGIAQIHVCAMDLPGSIGLFEIGKHLLISVDQGGAEFEE